MASNVVDVPPKLSARARVFATGQGRKTDATDAHSIALVGTRMAGLRRVVNDEQLALLRILVDRRRSLGADHTRMISQLHQLLLELIPGGAKKSLSAAQAKALLATVKPRDTVGKTRRRVAAELIGDLERVYQRSKQADKELKELVASTGTTLMDLHGIGPSGAARLLVEVGQIARFPNRAHFASWNGTAPIDASSGDQVRHRLSRAGNRQINRVLHIMATVQLRNPTEGRAYFDRKKTAGKTSMEAMRVSETTPVRHRLPADDRRRHRPQRTGPGGHQGTSTDSSVTSSHPHAGSSEKSLPGPAETQPRTPARQQRLDTEGSHKRSSASGLTAGQQLLRDCAQDRCPARLGPGARRDAPTLRLPTGVIGVALSWPAVSSGTARGEAGKGFVLLEVAVPSLLFNLSGQLKEAPMIVIIGMDPHKRSATIEVINERAPVLAVGKYGTDKASYAEMLAAGCRFADRVWAVEGCNGIGKHIAHRLVHDGETVVDVQAKLSAQVRVFATGNGRKTDPVDAHSVALVALRTPNLVQVQVDPDLVVMGLLVDRRDELGRARTQTINRLHRLLLELFPGGAKQLLSARQARALIATIRPRDIVGKTRRRLVVELIGELEGIDKKIKTADRPAATCHRPRIDADGAARHRPVRRGPTARRRRRHPPIRRPGPVRLLERHRTAGRLLRRPSNATDCPGPATAGSTAHCTSWPSSSCATPPKGAPTSTPRKPPGRHRWNPCAPSKDACPMWSTHASTPTRTDGTRQAREGNRGRL